MRPLVLVTCSRGWRLWGVAWLALADAHDRHPDAVLLHGDEPRGDRRLAALWRDLGGEDEAMPAAWEVNRRGAGVIRNRLMVARRPVECLAFIRARSPGATDCAAQAADAGVPTLRFEDNEAG